MVSGRSGRHGLWFYKVTGPLKKLKPLHGNHDILFMQCKEVALEMIR